MLVHNSHDAYYREPSGPAPAGSQVTFRFTCDEANAVTLQVWNSCQMDYPMSHHGTGEWQTTVTMPQEPGLVWYAFLVYLKNGQTAHYGAPEDGLGGEGKVYRQGLHSWQITLYDPSYGTPEWMHGATIYQIFPDRFRKAPTESVDTRTDRLMHEDWREDFFEEPREGVYVGGSVDFYGGTINGIREKLGYIRDMGATVLYLNPLFEAQSNHRYDTADYFNIDPLLGTNEEFALLCEEAHRLGIRVMLDGVFSHTGADSIYFNKFSHYDSVGAVSGPESPYYRWYTFEHFPDKYRCWWGVDALPECRKQEPSYQKFILHGENSVVQHWLRAGADAWRLDVADELTMDFLRKLRRSAKAAKKDAVVLGEVWEDASAKEAYDELRCYCCGDTLDSVMNYPLRAAILSFCTRKSNAWDLVRLIEHQAEVYPTVFRYSLMNLLGSHDRARVLNMLADKEGAGMSKKKLRYLRLTHDEYSLASRRLRTALDILYALPGCPTLYYGDEAGLTGGPDPYNRRPFPWGEEDHAIQSYVQGKMTHYRDSAVLKYGFCQVEAVDEDTIRIRRYLDGEQDALGHKNTSTAQEIITVRRED